MPLYFLVFLATLGAAVILYAVSLVTVAVTRKPLPRVIRGSAARWLQTLHLLLSWSSVGVCWLLYFNVYRIHVDMAALGNAAFQAFTEGYTKRLSIVVLPYGAGVLTAVLGLWASPGNWSPRALWGIASLWLLSVVTTPWAAGALGDMHDQGYGDAAFQQLQTFHLIRSLSLTIAAIWAIVEDRHVSVSQTMT